MRRNKIQLSWILSGHPSDAEGWIFVKELQFNVNYFTGNHLQLFNLYPSVDSTLATQCWGREVHHKIGAGTDMNGWRIGGMELEKIVRSWVRRKKKENLEEMDFFRQNQKWLSHIRFLSFFNQFMGAKKGD